MTSGEMTSEACGICGEELLPDEVKICSDCIMQDECEAFDLDDFEEPDE